MDIIYDDSHFCSQGTGKARVGIEQGQIKNSGILVMRREFHSLGAYIAPRTPTERKLAEIFCSALRMDQVGIRDDFEELGGDSLIAASILMDIERAFSIAAPVASLAHSPTIEQLAPVLDELIRKRSE
jgi:acyl carrier protein